jgi:hypothetical protein
VRTAVKKLDRVRAGRKRCHRWPPNPSPYPEAGNHRRVRANRMRTRMPIQNTGDASGTVIRARTTWSGQRSRWVAATMASGTAMRRERSML